MTSTSESLLPQQAIEIIVGEPSAAEGNAMLATTSATHWVVVREGKPVPEATGRIERAIRELPGFALFYGDSFGPGLLRPFAPRPVFSPVRLRQHDYLGPLVVLTLHKLREIGGFREQADGAQILDVALRFDPAEVARIPEVLSIGPEIIGSHSEAATGVVRDYLARSGLSAEIVEVGNHLRRVKYPVVGNPLVSIVIPTRGSAGEVAGLERVFVVEAIRGIIERSTYADVEFVVVADDSMPQSVLDELYLVAGDRLTLVRWSKPFNFSAKMNLGAVAASGDYLLLLNDDVELVTEDWIEQMLGLAQQPDVGMVGALLYFEDGTLQHAGHLYDGGAAGHIGFGAVPGRSVVLDSLSVDREVSGVTAACALLSADTFRRVGGFSLQFPGNYNDVDLCFKVRGLELSIVCPADVRLYHFESRSRDARIAPSELDAIHARWFEGMQVDSYWRDPRNRRF